VSQKTGSRLHFQITTNKYDPISAIYGVQKLYLLTVTLLQIVQNKEPAEVFLVAARAAI